MSSSSFFTGKQVVVTGGAGFVGSHLVEALLAEGAKVLAIDNFMTGSRENVASFSDNPNFQLIEANVNDHPANYLHSLPQIDVCFHLASPASPPKYQAEPIQTYLVNSLATHYLLTYLRDNYPVSTFVFASTSEVYGDPQVHPQTEDYWGNVNPNGPRSCYDESKRMGETICGVFVREFGYDARIVRIFNTYGPRMDPYDGRVIPQFIQEALAGKPLTVYGDGSQTRSYCFVKDLVRGFLAMASTEGAKGQTINLGNPAEMTILETAAKVKELIGKQDLEIEFLPLPKDDPTRRRPDISKASEILGWQPATPLDEGLQATIKDFQERLD